MKKNQILFLFFILLISCKENSESYNDNSTESSTENITTNENKTNFNENSDEYSDGTYCAEVEYYNPSTGTSNTYNLDVEVENGELTVIHWSNSGWLDDSHFSPEDITDGECEFISYRGYRYTVTLGELGGCGYDVNNEIEEITCPKCGNEKDSYSDICSNCKRKIEKTCPKCGGYKFSIFDEYCDDCKNELENNDE